jgi:hypothetical protein
MRKRWQETLIVVEPETATGCHRKGFALYWARLSRTLHIGRSGTGKEIVDLIRKIASANPLWEGLRVYGELTERSQDTSVPAHLQFSKFYGCNR